MKNTLNLLTFFLLGQSLFAQVNSKLQPYVKDMVYFSQNNIGLIHLKETVSIPESGAEEFINSIVLNNEANKVAFSKADRDELGFKHIKYSILQNGVLIANKVITAHCKDGKLITLSGDLANVPAAENGFVLTGEQALAFALTKVNASKYKWENKEEEKYMREALNDPEFSYLPKAMKVMFDKQGKVHAAYQFNIYAEEPLYRANVFVDAASGAVLDEQALICHTDVPATAHTKYSGTQTITADYTGSLYRFRESQRGLGIETYNLKNTNVYSAAVDFTNTTSNWTTTGHDQGAADAHWGAEKTYDYYLSQHNRNSINNNGFKLLSFVHYQTNYSNAFWDGQRMTYGDGNGGSTRIFTALDVCGHEITHGLISHTGNMVYSYESGALNESYADIFGTAIENYGRPGNWNWKVGEDVTSSGFGLRDMSNPNLYNNPDTYGGNYYYGGSADNGGVHINSGVSNFWFYLLTTGGSGVNDLSHAYSVSGIGMTNAAKIAFRALTVYFTPTTNYAMARLLTIQAAKDLFGECSNEVIQTTRAWYAVGVGANYINGGLVTNFTSHVTSFCSAPAVVNFSNTSSNALSYTWSFGDGSTSTSVNPVHTYTSVGAYAVKLKTMGCGNVSDSITKTSFVVVNPPISSPLVSAGAIVCENSPVTLNASANATIRWYDSSTGGTLLNQGSSFSTPGLSTTTTFYAANTATSAPFFGGILSNTGGGNWNSNAYWLNFNVLKNSTLNSVVVYAQTAGDRIIQLRTSANTVLNTTTVNLSVGANTVVLNYNLVPGSNYRLGLGSGTDVMLYRTNSGVNYPYNIGNCVNITSSNSGPSAYYFFYNWKVTEEECASVRTPVTITINPLPEVGMSVPLAPLCLGEMIDMQGTPDNGMYIGDAMLGSYFNAAAGTGEHQVGYTYTDGNDCTNTFMATITVQECATGFSKTENNESLIRVYPNPASDFIVVTTPLPDYTAVISDALGRVVLNTVLDSAENKIALNGMAKGMYYVSIKNSHGETSSTFKFIKE